MNNNIKISLSIQLQGSTIVRREVEYTTTHTNKKTNKTYTKKYKTYKLVNESPAYLQKNLTEDAYNYFISVDSCPSKLKAKEWKKMKATERLEHNLKKLCEHYNGVSYTYHVYEE